MYKKGDYIVCTTSYSRKYKDYSQGFKENYCFKIDNNLNRDYVYFPDTGGHGWFEDTIRPATPEEILEYDRLGKPYDVTTIMPIKETDYLIPILKRFKII